MRIKLSNRVEASVFAKPELETFIQSTLDLDLDASEESNKKLRQLELHVIQNHFNDRNSKLIHLHQKHKSRSIFVEKNKTDNKEFKNNSNADALFTMDSGLKLIIRTADCLPLFFIFENKVSNNLLAGIIHAGWRGMNEKIISKTLDHAHKIWSLKEKANHSKLIFAIGSFINKKSYEVSQDVANHFNHCQPIKEKKGKYLLDLLAEAQDQIAHFTNLKKWDFTQKDNLFGCTFTNNDYYSHRRGDKPRNQNMIEILPE